MATIRKDQDVITLINVFAVKREDQDKLVRSGPHMKATAAIATFDPILCEVADSISV